MIVVQGDLRVVGWRDRASHNSITTGMRVGFQAKSMRGTRQSLP